MVLGTGQSLKIWRYGNLILPDTTSIYQYCLSMLGKAQFMIQWLKNALLGAISIFQRVFYAEKSAMQKFTIKISERPEDVPSSSPFRVHFNPHHQEHSGFIIFLLHFLHFDVSSWREPCLLFFDEFPYFLYSFPAHLVEFARLLQFIQRETFCVSVAVHQRTWVFHKSSVMPLKKDDKMWFLWDLMGLYGDLLGFNQQK